MSQISRSLNEGNGNQTSFTTQQNRGVLVAGLTCACFSALVTLITIQWFILMKRTFRHQLVMFLIFSDTFKALWYFIFPVVVFSRGPVQSSSAFCQVSGFFLSVGSEASDYAILMIAAHSLLYILRPPARSQDNGGLYPYRRLIYPFWIALPLLAASLAFINDQNGYTTAGTFCYLPRRPFWYRLALVWIPRYFILCLIFMMYTAVYIYVAVKFRSFSALHESDSNDSSNSHSCRSSRRSSFSDDGIAPDEPATSSERPRDSKLTRPTSSRRGLHIQQSQQGDAVKGEELDPWDEVSFITSKPLKRTSGWQPGIVTSDFAMDSHRSSYSYGTTPTQKEDCIAPQNCSIPDTQKVSECAHPGSQSTQSTLVGPAEGPLQPGQIPLVIQKLSKPAQAIVSDPLLRTRKAIRKQLRYLFIYPAVYVAMWIFPFASHCLLYNDYYVRNPVYWMTIVSTCMVSLQATVVCVVFSWREKPWRRVPENRKLSLENIRHSFSLRHGPQQRSAQSSVPIRVDEQVGNSQQIIDAFQSFPPARPASANWWEAEGRKRKDSVWMGTDANDVEAGRRASLTQNDVSRSVIEDISEANPAALSHVARPPEVFLEDYCKTR